MLIAEHIITYQNGAFKHGIYAGEDNVIYFDSQHTHTVLIENIDCFSQQKRCFIRTYPFRTYTRSESLGRAFDLLNDMPSTTLFTSDEHFVAWCINGDLIPGTNNKNRSNQAETPVRMTVKKILTSAVDLLAEHPTLQRQAEAANKYLPVILTSIQLGVELKKMMDAKKQS